MHQLQCKQDSRGRRRILTHHHIIERECSLQEERRSKQRGQSGIEPECAQVPFDVAYRSSGATLSPKQINHLFSTCEPTKKLSTVLRDTWGSNSVNKHPFCPQQTQRNAEQNREQNRGHTSSESSRARIFLPSGRCRNVRVNSQDRSGAWLRAGAIPSRVPQTG